MLLNSIKIKNLRCFQDFRTDFHPRLNVIVGEGASGKSTLLYAIKAVFPFITKVFTDFDTDLPKKAFNLYHYPYLSQSDFTIDSGDDTIKIDFTLDGEDFDFKSKFHHENGKMRSKSNIAYADFSESLLKKNKDYLPLLAYYSTVRHIKDRDGRLVKNISEVTPPPRACYQSFLDPHINYQENLAWFDSRNNHEAREIRLRKDLAYTLPELDILRRAIRAALMEEYHSPDFDPLSQEMFLREALTNFPIPASKLGQGYQSILLLTLDLVRRMFVANKDKDFGKHDFLSTPSIVLIDEIDMHLHLRWQREILPTLLKLFPMTQFIVSTNSQEVLHETGAKVIKLERSLKS
jgi:predicted ATP-binding protein involved in virulence